MMQIPFFFIVIFFLCFVDTLQAQGQDDYYKERIHMVNAQIVRRGITDKQVLEAIQNVKRHLFVPAMSRPFAYQDSPLPIGHGQTISQPYIVAFMTEAAQLSQDDKILEIGTGSGYQAAVLAEIVKEVYTIEIIEDLAKSAQKRLMALGYDNIKVKFGDGYQGWNEFAPFDAIVVTAAPDKIPPKLIEQLKIGGRMIIPVGVAYQELLRITKTEAGIKQENLLPVRFVPMVEGK